MVVLVLVQVLVVVVRLWWWRRGGCRVAGERDTEHEDDDEAQEFFISDASRMRTRPGVLKDYSSNRTDDGVRRVHEGDGRKKTQTKPRVRRTKDRKEGGKERIRRIKIKSLGCCLGGGGGSALWSLSNGSHWESLGARRGFVCLDSRGCVCFCGLRFAGRSISNFVSEKKEGEEEQFIGGL
ncbi:hypothetical protein K440DRAFT_628364, partial [Wilcoxina mikolae CBS 423.85]